MDNINTLKKLYLILRPAFKVKRRLLKHSYCPYIKDKDIWEYLSNYKWKKQKNLTIAEMVDDIINIDNIKIHMYLCNK